MEPSVQINPRHQPDSDMGQADLANGPGTVATLKDRIPTDDPQAALRFCRRLAQALATTDPSDLINQSVDAVQDNGREPGTAPVPVVSVVIPVYNELENLDSLHERLTGVLDEVGLAYEIVLVDDGSSDGGVGVLARNGRLQFGAGSLRLFQEGMPGRHNIMDLRLLISGQQYSGC